MLLGIISSISPFSTTLAIEIESPQRTANMDEHVSSKLITINGTNPYKHILSDFEADLAAQSYSRINSILRYVTKKQVKIISNTIIGLNLEVFIHEAVTRNSL